MRHRRLGHSDLVVSEVGFGTWTLVTDWWGRTDDPHDMIRAALDAGITFFDTAPVYGADGAGETILRDYVSRHDEIVLTTKVGYDIAAERKHPGQSERPHDWRPDSVRQQVDASELAPIALGLRPGRGLDPPERPDRRPAVAGPHEFADRLVRAVIAILGAKELVEELDAGRSLLAQDLDLGLPPVGDDLGQAPLLDS